MSQSIKQKGVLRPLSKPDGTESDHSTIVATFKLPKQRRAEITEFKFRPITKKGSEKFGKELIKIDWACIQKETSSKSAEELNAILQRLVCECFPERTRRIKSTDAVWFTSKNRRLSLIHI